MVRQRHAEQWQQLADRAGHRCRRQHRHQQRGDHTLDTTAPTGGTPDLAAASDSGSSSTDNITDVTAPSFTVALDPTVVAGDTVQLLLAGTPLAHPVTHTITAADVPAGSVSLAVTAGDLGADGGKAISAQFSDAVGNTSTTAALTITLDTTAPTVAITSAGGPINQASQTVSPAPAMPAPRSRSLTTATRATARAGAGRTAAGAAASRSAMAATR